MRVHDWNTFYTLGVVFGFRDKFAREDDEGRENRLPCLSAYDASV